MRDVNMVGLPRPPSREQRHRYNRKNFHNTKVLCMYSNKVPFYSFHFSQLKTLQTVNVTKVLACNLDTFRKRLFALSHPHTWVVELSQSMSA